MQTADQIRVQGLEYLKQAKAICDRADAEDRDFTDAERAEVARLLSLGQSQMSKVQSTGYVAVSEAARRQRQKAEDESLRKMLVDLGAGLPVGPPIGLTGAGPHGYLDPGGQASYGLGGVVVPRGAKWSADFERNYRGRMIGSKALIEPVGSVQVASPIDTLPGLGERVETLLQLIPTERVTGTDGVAFLRETVKTHAAAAVAAGTAKPESVYTVTKVDDRLRMVAHLTQAIPRQYLWNLTTLGRYLDGVLREGLILELERIIIAGSEALADEFPGFLATAGIQQVSFDTDVLRTCRIAITSLELVPIPTTGASYIFHPSDWETICLTEDLDENYKLRGTNQQLPVDRARRRLWGYPVALSLGITQGVGLLVDFRGSTHLWLGQTRVDWSESTYDTEESKTDFERNLVRFRAEVEAFSAATRPAGVVEIDLLAGS